jgi:hypothetical protein
MKSLFLKAVLFLLLGSQAWAGGSKPGFNLRIFMQAPKGGNPSQVVPMAVSNPDQVIPVSKFAILTEKHIAGLMKLPDGGTLVNLTETGMKIMETETINNMGMIMVVICNGRLVYAPEIDKPLRGGKILLPPALTDADYKMFEDYAQKRAKQ